MRIVLGLIGIIVLAGCNAPADIAAIDGATETAKAVTPSTSPTPAAKPTQVTPHKSLFSSWARIDGKFTVDLSNVVNHATGAGIATGERVLFVFSPTVICNAIVTFSGTEDSGTLTIANSQSMPNSFSANSRYCDPLEAGYDYAAMSGDQLRVCNGNVCQLWH